MRQLFIAATSLFFGCLLALPAQAIWYEASGQAVINNGNKNIARQRATQEAIQQALLFSGASVHSVQQMANGLLQDEHLEVRANGDVKSIEIISEDYRGDIVTVRIRADVFPQDSQCQASDYRKSVVTSWFPIRHRQQATAGQLFDLGQHVASRLQREFSQFSQYANIRSVAPMHLVHSDDPAEQAIALGKHARSQFVLRGEIVDLSLDTRHAPTLAFWQDDTLNRHFGLEMSLISATTGEQIIQKRYQTEAPWDFDLYAKDGPSGANFWKSAFGKAIDEVLKKATQEVDEALSCIPAFGRILAVRNDALTIDMGNNQGVKTEDVLQVFQMRQFFDDANRSHFQYVIHPVKVKVVEVFHDSARVQSIDGRLLGNIQPNDFVVRH